MLTALRLRRWLLPQSCFLCDAHSDELLCVDCLHSLPYKHTACPRCAVKLPVNTLCGQCQVVPPIQTSTRALFDYDYPINKLIHAAKFKQHLGLLTLLGKLMAQHLDLVVPPDVIMPVPLHPNRLRERGYNQSLLLARVLAKQLDIPLDYRACIRQRDTLRQSELNAKQRKTNVLDAFGIRSTQLLAHWQRVLLVDDVITTGTTVNEVAKTLMEVGIKRVDVWVCAKG